MRLKDFKKNGNYKAINDVSIPEGAIEGKYESDKTTTHPRFQYPKVRLKVIKIVQESTNQNGFNTRRCDWRLPNSLNTKHHRCVSIPEGAIEGRNEIDENHIAEKLFQYPKVRLKDMFVRGRQTLYDCFNTRRCDWRSLVWAFCWSSSSVSIPEGAIEGAKRIITTNPRQRFQYPKVRLKVFLALNMFGFDLSFNTRRCDWRHPQKQLRHGRRNVSIPEGAIEGVKNCKLLIIKQGFNTRRCDWRRLHRLESNQLRPQFQYPKVRLKGSRTCTGCKVK